MLRCISCKLPNRNGEMRVVYAPFVSKKFVYTFFCYVCMFQIFKGGYGV